MAAATGLELDHADACVQLRNPALPPFIGELLLDGIAVADSHLDLRLSRSGDDVITAVDRRDGAANLVIVK